MLLRQITGNTNEGILDIFKSEKELKDSPEFKGWLKLYLKNPDVAAMHKKHEEFLKYYNENIKEAPEDEINKMKQTATAIQKAQSMMKPRYMGRLAALVEEKFDAIRDAALKKFKQANGTISLYTAYVLVIEDQFPEIPYPGIVFQYMTDPLDPAHQDLVPQEAEDGSWADRADKEYEQNPNDKGFDPLIKGRWFAIKGDRDKYMDQGMEPEDALDKASERHGVDPEEVQKWIEAGNASKFGEGLVWSRQGGKQVRKYRCTSGVRKGRTMASPASCNMPLDVAKGQTLKKTKASKQGKVRMTGIKTRAQNVRSRRLQTINRPTNRKRGGRI